MSRFSKLAQLIRESQKIVSAPGSVLVVQVSPVPETTSSNINQGLKEGKRAADLSEGSSKPAVPKPSPAACVS